MKRGELGTCSESRTRDQTSAEEIRRAKSAAYANTGTLKSNGEGNFMLSVEKKTQKGAHLTPRRAKNKKMGSIMQTRPIQLLCRGEIRQEGSKQRPHDLRSPEGSDNEVRSAAS